MIVLLLLKKKLVLVKQLFSDVFVIRNTLPGKSLTGLSPVTQRFVLRVKSLRILKQ
ncbi:hypothetical protein COCOBI_pt-0440 (chloroplast) [Coccomyxa sp. Obi]|nr:hypothetical protein COCOBI_pt-0440 [Coccomyxa sp. Obi]